MARTTNILEGTAKLMSDDSEQVTALIKELLVLDWAESALVRLFLSMGRRGT